MKNIYILLIACFISITAFAQAPEGMSYQAVIKDAQNRVLISKKIGIKISILQDANGGSAVYSETQSLKTNSNGLVSLTIGAGDTQDSFGDIDWAFGSYYIKTEIDPKGGNNYAIKGTSQLLSVPYALHAKTAEGVVGYVKGAKPKDGAKEIDPFFTASPAGTISNADISNWDSGIESNASDISINTIAISTLETEQTEQKDAITLNTAKEGITATQSSAISFNSLKTGITAQQAIDITENKTHSNSTNNPHSISKSQIGLGNVNNTSDLDKPISALTQSELDAKVNKENGKGLSTNDYSTVEQTKLAGITAGAEVNVQANWNQTTNTADDFIKNKPIIQTVPTNVSEFANDAGYVTTSNDADADSNNEIQNLTLSGKNLTISSGNTVVLPNANPTFHQTHSSGIDITNSNSFVDLPLSVITSPSATGTSNCLISFTGTLSTSTCSGFLSNGIIVININGVDIIESERFSSGGWLVTETSYYAPNLPDGSVIKIRQRNSLECQNYWGKKSLIVQQFPN